MKTHRQEGQSQSTAMSSEVDNNSNISSDDNNVNQVPDSKFKIKSGNGFSLVDTKAWINFMRKSSNANFMLSTIVKSHNKLVSEITIGNFVPAQAVDNVI